MKNYKTTIIGALLAGLSFLSIYQANGGDLSNWQQWLIPAAIAILGYVAKDAGVTGPMKALAVCFCMLSLTSCGLTREQWAVIGKDVLIREAPIVYGQVQQAKTSAKNPVKVNP